MAFKLPDEHPNKRSPAKPTNLKVVMNIPYTKLVQAWDFKWGLNELFKEYLEVKPQHYTIYIDKVDKVIRVEGDMPWESAGEAARVRQTINDFLLKQTFYIKNTCHKMTLVRDD